MKYFALRAAVIVCLVFSTTPGLALAQSSDGGGRGNRSYGLNSEAQAAVAALGDASVEALSIPVLLGVELSDLTKNFGDPRDGGTRTHEGLDILAPEGTPIASPTDAVVIRAGDGSDSGLYVRTMNPGGESFVYMHLISVGSGIQTGTVLKRGDIIGFVGNTGNASGGPAHLHFEIRKNGATDPYPRLTQTFTLAERMQGVEQALLKGGVNYAAIYASRFHATFDAARAQGIPVPPVILTALDSAPVPTSPVVPGVQLANTSIVFGGNNARIVELQKFLINATSGSESARLARAGATGYFGSITEAALIEYQRSAALAPTGVVDTATYTQIFALTNQGDTSETLPEGEVENGGGTTPSGFTFTRDLEVGMSGEDVRELQKFLNTHGSAIAPSDAGSPGNETDYFGSLTRAALARYQASVGITPAVGYFGPITRAAIASL